MLGLNTNDTYIVNKISTVGDHGTWPVTNKVGLIGNLVLNPGEPEGVLLRLSKVPGGAGAALTNQPALFSVLGTTNGFLLVHTNAAGGFTQVFSEAGTNFCQISTNGDVLLGPSSSGSAPNNQVPLYITQGTQDGGSGNWAFYAGPVGNTAYQFGRNSSEGYWHIYGQQSGHYGEVLEGVGGPYAIFLPKAQGNSGFDSPVVFTNGALFPSTPTPPAAPSSGMVVWQSNNATYFINALGHTNLAVGP
jgi:hypothetical protein